jgi:membrane protein implicated in regulation of membrane protease activity
MELFGLPGWSIWGMIAVVLLIVEMVTVAYVALGLSLGAALAGVIVWLMPDLAVPVQALIWALSGLAIWAGLSRLNRERHKRPDINDFDSLDALPPSDRSADAPRNRKGR